MPNAGNPDGVPNADVHSFVKALFAESKTAGRCMSAIAFSSIRMTYQKADNRWRCGSAAGTILDA
jgi:hypothetical protein